nr:hypothetical protein [Candidatus Sigynarchaeota archaeon]
MGRNYYNFVKKNPNYLPPQEPGNDETFKAKKKASGRSDDSILSETSSICYAFLVTGQSEHVIDIYNNHPGEHICRMAALARFYQGDYDKAKQIISSHRMNNYGDIDIKNLDATLIQKKIKDPVGLLTDLHDEFFY